MAVGAENGGVGTFVNGVTQPTATAKQLMYDTTPLPPSSPTTTITHVRHCTSLHHVRYDRQQIMWHDVSHSNHLRHGAMFLSCQVTGSPTEECWAGVKDLPDYDKVRWRRSYSVVANTLLVVLVGCRRASLVTSTVLL